MADQWIPARKALEIVNSELTLTNALRSGRLKAKAELVKASNDEYSANPIRADFWQTDRYQEFKADWRTGYFSNVIDGIIEVYIYGLTIELSGILQLVPAEERGLIAQRLSVAGDPDWLTALEARALCFSVVNPINAAAWLREQARLGFATARAVSAEMKRASYDDYRIWTEREWDVPVWFWGNFKNASSSQQSWETGSFSSRGQTPGGSGEVILSGVHFHAPTLRRLTGQTDEQPSETTPDNEETGKKGRKPTYDWFAATSAVWGKLFRDELRPLPENQADIEKALIAELRIGDKEPGESTVRPYAKYIFDEFEKP